jgi:hypothetical protein
MKVIIPGSSYQLLRSFSLHLLFKGMSCLVVKETVRITSPRDALHYALIVRYILIILLLLLKVALPILIIMLVGYRSRRREDCFVGAVAARTRRPRSYLLWPLNIQKILPTFVSVVASESTENSFKTVSQLSNGCGSF